MSSCAAMSGGGGAGFNIDNALTFDFNDNENPADTSARVYAIMYENNSHTPRERVTMLHARNIVAKHAHNGQLQTNSEFMCASTVHRERAL